MLQEIIIAGFGGQGVMSMGQQLTYAGMLEGRNVSWLPSYGPEMRGGTANCNVIISDEQVGSPIVTHASAVIALNSPSLDKFEDAVVPGGLLFINSSLIERKSTRDDIQVFYIPANEIAEELGNKRVANSVMLGAYLAKAGGGVSSESIIEALKNVLGPSKQNLIPINEKALERGAELV
ncbi:MAG: 2-oxoacid:acceptor oxidoreductase family protein [Clostridia bacterium]|nr:2-oxoacid:acceptor oxidoreductase family protein [Clostridia bacterium]MDD4680366.1 2-oxoacid:acceptor oxidoreductase family protein [Clostridia bacterium]